MTSVEVPAATIIGAKGAIEAREVTGATGVTTAGGTGGRGLGLVLELSGFLDYTGVYKFGYGCDWVKSDGRDSCGGRGGCGGCGGCGGWGGCGGCGCYGCLFFSLSVFSCCSLLVHLNF